tara:strand:- start:1138 stop:1764 length:627 start_codon:yes stop_codon:yes gene_type:complete
MSNFGEDTALVLIDIQNDFCPGGALAVDKGDEIVEISNKIQEQFKIKIITQDWHPSTHKSFASNHEGKEPLSTVEMFYGQQVLWPNHCIQGTEGSKFHSKLITDSADLIIRKGFRPEIDSYSAFFENDQKTPTGLDGYLKSRGVNKIYLCGLALDFCVYFSAIDGAELGYNVNVIQDACRAIDLDGSLEKSLNDMKSKGVKLLSTSDL